MQPTTKAKRGTRSRLWAVLVLSLALAAVAPASVQADDHEPTRSAHPLRGVAYLLHPIGVVLDTLIVRPAHWLVHLGPLEKLFGHTD